MKVQVLSGKASISPVWLQKVVTSKCLTFFNCRYQIMKYKCVKTISACRRKMHSHWEVLNEHKIATNLM